MRSGTFDELSPRQGRTRKPHAARSPKGEHRTGEECERSDPLMPKEKISLALGGWRSLPTTPSHMAGNAGSGAAPQGVAVFFFALRRLGGDTDFFFITVILRHVK